MNYLSRALFPVLLAIAPVALAAPDEAERYVEDTGALAEIANAGSAVEKDRLAILAMQGEHEAFFNFEETVVFEAGYQRRKAKPSAGYEWVVAVENSPEHIVLQHLLVSKDGKHVIKHWRQDWHYQASERLQYVGNDVWRMRPVPAEDVAGSWTQCVYEVSDAPRYCGTGRWQHGLVSTWQSDHSWRPLPRREYTTRDDYNVLDVVNRHRIVPGGWTHEQDNLKAVSEAGAITALIVGERGFNDYRRLEGHDFAPAKAYWHDTADYWARVRAEWQRRIDADKGVTLGYGKDGMPLIKVLFEQAEKIRAHKKVKDSAIARAIGQWASPPGTTATAAETDS
jgi:hypothetical protein